MDIQETTNLAKGLYHEIAHINIVSIELKPMPTVMEPTGAAAERFGARMGLISNLSAESSSNLYEASFSQVFSKFAGAWRVDG